MTSSRPVSVQRVAILSTNGTGRVTGHGHIVGRFASDIAIVLRDNGKRAAINDRLLRVEATT